MEVAGNLIVRMVDMTGKEYYYGTFSPSCLVRELYIRCMKSSGLPDVMLTLSIENNALTDRDVELDKVLKPAPEENAIAVTVTFGLVEETLKGSEPENRLCAVLALGMLGRRGGNQALNLAKHHCEDDNMFVRMEALVSVTRTMNLENPEEVPEPLTVLRNGLQDRDPTVQRLAACCLWRVAEECRKLEGYKDEFKSAGPLNLANSIKNFCEILKSPDQTAVLCAVKSVRQVVRGLKCLEAVALVMPLATHSHGVLRAEVISTLKDMAPRGHPEAMSAGYIALKDSEVEVRMNALLLLYNLVEPGDEEYMAKVIEVLRNDAEPNVRAKAAGHLVNENVVFGYGAEEEKRRKADGRRVATLEAKKVENLKQRAILALCESMKELSAYQVRMKAIRSLKELITVSSPEVLAMLQKAKDDINEIVVSRAKQIEKKLGIEDSTGAA